MGRSVGGTVKLSEVQGGGAGLGGCMWGGGGGAGLVYVGGGGGGGGLQAWAHRCGRHGCV